MLVPQLRTCPRITRARPRPAVSGLCPPVSGPAVALLCLLHQPAVLPGQSKCFKLPSLPAFSTVLPPSKLLPTVPQWGALKPIIRISRFSFCTKVYTRPQPTAHGWPAIEEKCLAELHCYRSCFSLLTS